MAWQSCGSEVHDAGWDVGMEVPPSGLTSLQTLAPIADSEWSKASWSDRHWSTLATVALHWATMVVEIELQSPGLVTGGGVAAVQDA